MDEPVASAEAPSGRQALFARYLVAILIDLTVLNLFDEYWQQVSIDSFSVSVLTAILLQVLLKLTLAFEHRVALFFTRRAGALWRFLRIFCAWLILFGSKFLMLGAIDLAFGDLVSFTGPLHGVVAFIVVVVVMLVAEEGVVRIYRGLASGNADKPV
ncbi:MAG: hypothetical protein AAGE43_10215 [Pseudomonadota bacterium]